MDGWLGWRGVVELGATLSFATSGLIEASRKKLDVVGVCVVAFLTAFGGGTLRDVLLDRRPFFWVEHADWVTALLVLCIAAMLLLRAQHIHLTARAMQWPDAIGLGLFAASGTQVALDAGMPAIVAALMGTVTAVFGGVLRDIVCNDIPRTFIDHRPYAVCAFAGAWVVIGSAALALPASAGLLLGAGVAVALRVFGLVFGWRVPAWRQHE
jgi:uncharacterized membrane protein YeiH